MCLCLCVCVLDVCEFGTDVNFMQFDRFLLIITHTGPKHTHRLTDNSQFSTIKRVSIYCGVNHKPSMAGSFFSHCCFIFRSHCVCVCVLKLVAIYPSNWECSNDLFKQWPRSKHTWTTNNSKKHKSQPNLGQRWMDSVFPC